MSKESPIIVGLDIGTTKIAAIAGRKNEYGKLEILGFGRAVSSGVEHGKVLNIDQTTRAINEALKNCLNSNPDLDFKEVFVGIAGHHIKSLQTRGDMVREDVDVEISPEEIQQLIADQFKTYVPAGDKIIDVIPQVYTVDGHRTTSPVGRVGVKVGADFHIVTGDKNAIRNINRSVERSGLKIKDLVLQPLASSASVMCDQDMEAGIAILDIGGGTSDLTVFHEGILKHTAVIPYGGENVTKDIKVGLGVLKTQAEQMKVQFGSALADGTMSNAYITIPGFKGHKAKEISVENLSNIIQARMEEILGFVGYNLKQAGMDNRMLNGGIILTGGGSQLKHIIQLTEFTLGVGARIGYPNEHLASGYIRELSKPMYSTCIGLILKGYNDFENNLRRIRNEQEEQIVFGEEEIIEEPEEKDVFLEEEESGIDFKLEEGLEEVDSEEGKEKTKVKNINIKKRRTIKDLFDSMKQGVIELFREDGDTQF